MQYSYSISKNRDKANFKGKYKLLKNVAVKTGCYDHVNVDLVTSRRL